jgi:hypothetical protein
MTASVLPPKSRTASRRLGPVSARLESSLVIQGHGRRGDLLELRLTVPLDAVPGRQRRTLAALLRSPDDLTLRLAEGADPEGAGATA